jgi:death-on-curing protein
VTYRELKQLLGGHGYSLENPDRNYIDIVRVSSRRKFFLFGAEKQEFTKIGQIGFPRWTAEVSQGDIKRVREMTGLVAKQGVDSASFFHGVDPMQTLITSYHEPLMRLSER